MRAWKTIPGFVRVAKIGKTHGADGEVKVHIEDQILEVVLGSEFLFVDIEGSKVPFEVEAWRSARGLVAKFFDIDDASAAAAFIGCDVYLPEDQVDELAEPTSDLAYGHLVSYTVVDATLGVLGKIKDVQSYPQQEMAILDYGHKEALIPLNPTFILAIDDASKEVNVDLPGGLLDQ